MKIFINPGHAPGGQPDPGAVGVSGLKESTVAAAVGNMVSAYLERVGHETMTYQANSLSKICNEANAWPADVVVSIHCNAAVNRAAKGTETWYYPGSSASFKLAGSIQTQLVTALATVDRGLKPSTGLYVLRHTAAPTVLVELAFISNSAEEQLLADPAWQDRAAAAIARGITDWGCNY